MPAIEEISNSRARLIIAGLVSSRPRTLGELAEMTHISVQGVLKHLVKLEEQGIIKEWNMPRGRYLRQRKLYYIEGRKVADFSQDDILVAAIGSAAGGDAAGAEDVYGELDRLAQDIIIQERRARELSKKMMRTIEELLASESRMGALIDSTRMTPEEKQVAFMIFGDDGPERARKILREHYGCPDPEGAIRAVTQRIRRSGHR